MYSQRIKRKNQDRNEMNFENEIELIFEKNENVS